MPIIELNRHEPSVDSVIERLDRYRNKIENITTVVTWKNGEMAVHHDTKPLSDLSYEAIYLMNYVQELMNS